MPAMAPAPASRLHVSALVRSLIVGVSALAVVAAPRVFAQAPQAQTPPGTADIPTTKVVMPKIGDDYERREVMIPMRDGVKLKTFILVPKGVSKAPILLTRTPYDAENRVMHFNSPHLAAVPQMLGDSVIA